MNKFPNAAKGISNIFTAQILSLIAILATGIASILAAVMIGGVQVGSSVAAGASGIGMMIFGTGAGILAIIALIIDIVGVVQASKDEESFKLIIKLTIFSLIVAVVGAIISAIFRDRVIMASIVNAVTDIISLICSILIIVGIGNLAIKLENNDVAERCNSLLKVILWIGILAIACRFFALFMPSTLAAVIVILLLVASLVLYFVEYILFISLLAKAKKMLQ